MEHSSTTRAPFPVVVILRAYKRVSDIGMGIPTDEDRKRPHELLEPNRVIT